MTLSILSQQPVSCEEWDECAKADDAATFFHSSLWARLFCEYAGNSMFPDARRVTFSDGTAAILCLCRRRVKGLFTDHVSSPAGNYGGWVGRGPMDEQHARLLAGCLMALGNVVWRENPYDPVLGRIDIPGSLDDFTQTADLREGFDAVYARWSRGHETAAKKARRLGVVVRRAGTLAEWRTHYDMYRSLRQRWSRASSKYSWRLFETLHAHQSDHVVLWRAELDGEPLSSVVCFYWNRHAVAWHGAASSNRFNVRANHLMYHEIMRDAAEKGYDWFDMNPSGGNQGVVGFKKHLGCERLRSRVMVKRRGVLGLVRRLRGLG